MSLFHPVIASWFDEVIGSPTEIQRLAWPRIAAGEHLLVCAPTGSGKTLTAFLWALQQLLTGAWPAEGRGRGGRIGPRVLYVSPLRALNTDIRRNLERPLAELSQRFADAGLVVPEVRALTRSGDTPQSERQKMLRKPPQILITTPESLNILLTSEGGRRLLGDLETVILDEIHAVVPSKRGTHLITAIERLVPLSGEFQRLALSATVRPLERVAQFVGGYELLDGGAEDEPLYRRRAVAVVRSTADKQYTLRVRFPAGARASQGRAVSQGKGKTSGKAVISGRTVTNGPRERPGPADPRRRDAASTAEAYATSPPRGDHQDDSFWRLLADDCKRQVAGNRSTLVFANSRRLTEKVTRLINEGELGELATSHHGSLSREVRSVVERQLKDGALKAIVATSSLELGIDIGDLDEVVLIQSPRSLASAVQRVGRAGHGVGQVSRGVLYPTHGRDLLDAVVVAQALRDHDIEEVHPVRSPFDVLAQVLVSMTAGVTWKIDDLHAVLRTSDPYHGLTRRQLERVLEMLAGRDARGRVRELQARVSIDRVRGTVKGRPGAARRVYMAGGTIADRGLFTLRREDDHSKLGQLDEEFVWERTVGDTFTLGAQGWQVRKITHNDVLVAPSRGATGIAPFWRSDAEDRTFDYTQRAAEWLSMAESRLDDPTLAQTLHDELGFDPQASEALLEFLRDQKAATRRLPSHRHVLAERCPSLDRDREVHQMVLHTGWGGTVNRPLAIALAAAWEESQGDDLEAFHDDDGLLLRLPREVPAAELFAQLDPDHVEALLRHKLESTGFFGSRFRVAAGIALLLPRAGFRTRTPLWMSRQRAKRLLETVAQSPDFPVLLEAWRSCLQDDFDLPNLKQQLARVRSGELPLIEVRTDAPSPFAAGLLWRHTNHYMYEDDTPEGGKPSRLGNDVLRELVFASDLRPRLPRELVASFRRKIQRLAPDYAPKPGDDLRDWVLERLWVPADEWRELLGAVVRDAADSADSTDGQDLAKTEDGTSSTLDTASVAQELFGRVVAIELPGAELPGVVALDALPRLLEALGLGLDEVFLGEVGERLGLEPLTPTAPEIVAAAQRLIDAGPVLAELADESGFETDEGVEDQEATRLAGLATVVAEWLRYQGPVDPRRLAVVWGRVAQGEPGEALIATLVETQRVVADPITKAARTLEVCDADNLEILLRWLRVAGRPSFEPLPAERLPLFLAQHQGLTRPGDGVEALRERLEQLFGLPLPAELWESDVLPARLAPYYPAWLDSLMPESSLCWLGMGNQKLAFAFEEDLDLFREPTASEGPNDAASGTDDLEEDDPAEDDTPDHEARQLLGAGGARLELGELAQRSGLDLATVSDTVWRLAWAGAMTNSTFLAVRKGLETRFEPPAVAVAKARPPRGGRGGRGVWRRPGRGSWQRPRLAFGQWRALPSGPAPSNALEATHLDKDRARQLLARYGVVCRELLARESPSLRWARVFRALRLMELSGEVVAGQFFRGLRGLQFVTPAALQKLREGLDDDAVFALCAADPASLCGVEVAGVREELPARRRSTTLVYHGARLVVVASKSGKELDVRVGPEHPRLTDYLLALGPLLTREVRPLPSIEVTTINGEPAPASSYGDLLAEIFRVTREPAALRLWKRYGAA